MTGPARAVAELRLRAAAGGPVATATLAVLAAVILVLAVHLVVFLDYGLAVVRAPFGLDYGEGIVWQQAMLIPGARMYGDITRYPFLVFHYPPVYHLVVHALVALGADGLVAGRSVSLAASLATGALLAALAAAAAGDEPRIARVAGGAVAGLGFFCLWPVVIWAPLMRVDMLALALSFGGMLCAAHSTSRPWLLSLAMVLFVLAVFTKQTSIAASLSTLPVMLLATPRRTVRVCCLGLLLAVATLCAMTWVTQGGFVRHLLLYNLNRYTLSVAFQLLATQMPQVVFLTLAAIALVDGWLRLTAGPAWGGLEPVRGGAAAFGQVLRRHEPTRLLAILTLHAGFSTAMLVTLGKSGGSLNYMIEWMGVLVVLSGLLAALVTGRALTAAWSQGGTARAVFGLLVAAALLAQVTILPAVRDLGPETADTAQRLELEARIGRAVRPVLSDDMVLLMRAGVGVPWEPAIFAELASTGRWDEGRIVAMIAEHRFAFVVTQGEPSERTFDSRYTPAVQHAITEAYPRTKAMGHYAIHLEANSDRD